MKYRGLLTDVEGLPKQGQTPGVSTTTTRPTLPTGVPNIFASGADPDTNSVDGDIWIDPTPPAGSGDMTAAIYDPTSVESDAFNMDNMVEGSTAKVFTGTERTKLSGIATGATANSPDATLLSRTNHTGEQAISTVTNLQTSLDAKAPLASPTFTGTPAAPTAAADTNTTQLATTAFVQAEKGRAAINVRTANYTAALSDAGKIVEMNLAGANTFTITSEGLVNFPVGSIINVVQYGAGATTIVAGGGVTIRKRSAFTFVLAGQYAQVSLYKRAADEWMLTGDLTLV